MSGLIGFFTLNLTLQRGQTTLAGLMVRGDGCVAGAALGAVPVGAFFVPFKFILEKHPGHFTSKGLFWQFTLNGVRQLGQVTRLGVGIVVVEDGPLLIM